MQCEQCEDDFEDDVMVGSCCRWCAAKRAFATFAGECGLSRFVDPTGERYVYSTVSLACSGKKSEEIDLMDELWNALATAKGRDDMKVSG